MPPVETDPLPTAQESPPDAVPPRLVACHDCDALFQLGELHPGDTALCPHCGAKLHAVRPNSLHRCAAFALSAASLFLVANLFPFIELKAGGQSTRIVLAQSVSELSEHGTPWLAAAVAIFILAAPALMVSGMLYVLLPLLNGRRWPGAALVCRWIYGADPWNMIEVFLIGVLVSLMKLGDIAKVTLGISFWAFICLIVCMAAALSSMDRRELWDRLESIR